MTQLPPRCGCWLSLQRVASLGAQPEGKPSGIPVLTSVFSSIQVIVSLVCGEITDGVVLERATQWPCPQSSGRRGLLWGPAPHPLPHGCAGRCCRTGMWMAGTGCTGRRRCGHVGVLGVLRGTQKVGDFWEHHLSQGAGTGLRTSARPCSAIPGRFWRDPLDLLSLCGMRDHAGTGGSWHGPRWPPHWAWWPWHEPWWPPRSLLAWCCKFRHSSGGRREVTHPFMPPAQGVCRGTVEFLGMLESRRLEPRV